ncbi:hypothetical protein [Bradyrhizobium yuanmingense]|uniref:hypothetical protein n=1 Tax=Bradyrhizobium yuanmingense TaxID=108015 RepID=UPI00187D1F34|nr:hypothetical protein [Bradyrhizobium yuanmingense]
MTQSLTYVEIDIPVCSLTYGVAPCTASIPTTGDVKCFNSIKTCQDRDNFTESEVTLRFAKPTEYLPREIDCIPSIVSVDFSPATVSLGKDLGQRASLTVTFQDHPHSDTGQGYDKYRTERPYDPYRQGSYWGKFRARQPFLRGRALRWINGVVGEALAGMETFNFVIESFNGPSPEGRFTIVAKDLLKLADGDRAQCPVLSNGFLAADITAGATTATLLPAGIGNAEYPAGGTDYLCIGGNEIVQYTRVGDTLTITRGQLGTTASAHRAQDRVQVVKHFAATDAADILHDLLVNYADVDAGKITLSDWQDETGTFLGNVYTGTVTEPTSVATLCAEIIEQAALAVWHDPKADQLRLQVLRAVPTDANTFTPENTIEKSLSIKEQESKRISRVQVYFGRIDPTKPLSNQDNYRSTSLIIDEDAEADYGVSSIKTILSRWIPQAGRSVADRLGVVLLGRYRAGPRQVQFKLQRRASTDVQLGVGYRVEAQCIQDATGADSDIPIQITRHNPWQDGQASIEAEEMLWSAPAADTGSRYVIFDANNYNINVRTSHDSIYPPAQSGDVVTCIVNAGVTIGSVSKDLVAVDVGSWPAGVAVILIVRGRIQGAGGRGGRGGTPAEPNGEAGQQGGNALFVRRAITLDISSGGEIWGGGGGGGGGGMPQILYPGAGAGGGGGGAGAYVGAGGVATGGTAAFSGAAGTATAGGAGGLGHIGGQGGTGGGPGLAGGSGHYGDGAPIYSPGAGGPAGAAIDGISYITLMLGAGDIRGSQVN